MAKSKAPQVHHDDSLDFIQSEHDQNDVENPVNSNNTSNSKTAKSRSDASPAQMMGTTQREPLSPTKKAAVAAMVIACLGALVGGLVGGLTSRDTGINAAATEGEGEDSIFSKPASLTGLNRLNFFDESVLDGYQDEQGCQDLRDDLTEAVELLNNITIDNYANSYFRNPPPYICRGDADDCFFEESPPVMMEEAVPTDFDPPISDQEQVAVAASPGVDGSSRQGEDSYGTNNQVLGVDEADLVKSDGTYVFAAYSDKLVVWDAKEGTKILSETVIPTQDENGIGLCDDLKVYNIDTTVCYRYVYNYDWWRKDRRDLSAIWAPPPQPIKISSIMLHEERLVVIATTTYSLTNESPILEGERFTRMFVFDISENAIPTDGSALKIIGRKDLQGSYQTARSIGKFAHIVTSSTLDTRSHLDQYLYPWNGAFAGMNETEYRNRALEISREKSDLFAATLTNELIEQFDDDLTDVVDDCSKIAKVAIMLRPHEDADDTSYVLPSFTSSSVLKTLTQVHSLNILQDLTENSGTKTRAYPLVSTMSSGIFMPTSSYTNNIYASAEKLVIAGEAYVQDSSGDWDEFTVFLVYGLNSDTSIPEAVGSVKGSLLNQFSMDHYFHQQTKEDYLRVATTSWGKWGLVNGTNWGQIEVSESQVSVLKMPSSNADSIMKVVGNATGIGLGERIYAARFFGEKAYVVTFRQIDPFYTVDMSDPTNPIVVGELKIPGFSNYLHPVSENLILALGQNATEEGRTDGLQISLFDVSNFTNPRRINQFVETSKWSSSDAQYEHKAFRYLPQSKLLILPLYINSWWQDKEFFDGFVVYDVDESRDFSRKFNISHVDGKEAENFCWSSNSLPSRSLVFDGNVTTLKGHKVLSHALDHETLHWELNLDKDREKSDFCYPWRFF